MSDQFELVQEVDTNGARDWKAFTLNGAALLAAVADGLPVRRQLSQLLTTSSCGLAVYPSKQRAVMATTCACIAGVLADLSRSEEALNYSRTCLAMRLAVLGERHVNTASIFH
jgi:hypothetical protein